MKTFNREADGTTYYYVKGVLYGHPTNADGTCDFDIDVECEVGDYMEPLTAQEVAEIEKELA